MNIEDAPLLLLVHGLDPIQNDPLFWMGLRPQIPNCALAIPEIVVTAAAIIDINLLLGCLYRLRVRTDHLIPHLLFLHIVIEIARQFLKGGLRSDHPDLMIPPMILSYMRNIPLSKGIAIALVVVRGVTAVPLHAPLHAPALICVANRVIAKAVSARKDKDDGPRNHVEGGHGESDGQTRPDTDIGPAVLTGLCRC